MASHPTPPPLDPSLQLMPFLNLLEVKPKQTNGDLLALVFPRLAPVTCASLSDWFIGYLRLSDSSECLEWFWNQDSCQ